jgi:quercetin dioxygenase-like cupin family protein
MDLKTESASITNKVTGERITFLESSKDTNGEYEYIEVFLPAKGQGPPLHYHLKFEETFEVLDGELKLDLGEQSKQLSPGDTYIIAPNVHHTFSNASDTETLTFRVKITPASHFEESMRIGYGLIEDGKVNKKGLPKKKMHTAVILEMQDTRIVSIPSIVQKLILNRLARKAKKNGTYEELVKKYT